MMVRNSGPDFGSLKKFRKLPEIPGFSGIPFPIPVAGDPNQNPEKTTNFSNGGH
jgi:hypothetical protein